jgi:hypothetical protein
VGALPFADVVHWEAFSVAVHVPDVLRLREVLERIPVPKAERINKGCGL